MPGKVKVNGVWKDVAGSKVKVNGTWKDVAKSFTKVNGAWKEWLGKLLPGMIDTSFNTGTGFNNAVYSIAVQSDGKILVGGQFSSLNGNTRNELVRLNADGTEDTAFYSNLGSGFNSTVYSIAVQADGKILVGGAFTSFRGNTRNRLVRLNSNGTEDTAFYSNLGSGFNNFVKSIAIQSDGKILVGGFFTSVDGTTRSCIARLNANGALDTSFDPGTGAYYSGAFIPDVRSIAVQSDGKILVGGLFASFDGTNVANLVRLNAGGTVDTSFLDDGEGFQAADFSNERYVTTIAIQPDGKILVSQQGTSFSGTPVASLLRINTNGTLDLSGTNTGFSYYLSEAMAVQSDGKILIAGPVVDTSFRRIVFRVNDDLTLDQDFVSPEFDGVMLSMTLQSDGKILVGGTFTSINGSTRNRIARIISQEE